ncbi:MAG TPA: CRISPR-associated helicase Cas3' [Nitrososphaeraceae archaeon]|nr:CRISPR-associated helicase Cas3' [Nitrososphaeraceae archaeon]
MSNFYRLKSHPNRYLYNHLEAVARQTAKIFETGLVNSSFISQKDYYNELIRTAYVTGATHDIGKGTKYFQQYLLDKLDFDPLLKSHSFISSLYSSFALSRDPVLSNENRDFLILVSSLAIQGHHGSLKRPTSFLKGLDFFDERKIFLRQVESFENVQEIEGISNKLKIFSFSQFIDEWETCLFDFCKILLKWEKILKNVKDYNDPYFLIHTMFSSLLDADRLDASSLSIIRNYHINNNSISNYVSNLHTEQLANKIKQDRESLSNQLNKNREFLFNQLNRISREVDLNQKILTLTAPTGIGKTLSSMNFAINLRNRISETMRYTPRIIYVAPFISILDQNVKVFEKALQSNIQSNVLLLQHHLAPINYYKDIVKEQKNETYNIPQSELFIDGWHSEIIVTTFIQFFNTIFGRYTSQLRRFHNLIGSIVILDEIQSIPFEYWGIVREVLLFLGNRLKCTIIMMTATQPLIFHKNELFEIAPKFVDFPKRVTFYSKINHALTLDEFCMDVKIKIREYPTKSILIETNTIRSAIEVYNAINNFRTVFFLSSQVIPIHRGPRITEIDNRLKNSEPIVLVSTQVVEAGVDLDFNIAVRDIGPIDSIIQTAGRCNRNGIRKDTESPFFIYRVVNKENNSEIAKSVYGPVAIEISKDLLIKNQSIEDLLNSYYHEISTRRSGQKSVNIKENIKELNYESIEENFNLIDQEFKEPVFIEYDDEATSIWNEFLSIFNNSNKKINSRSQILRIRHLMEQYMISVSRDDINRFGLQENFGIYKVDKKDINEIYNNITGFAHS